MSDEQADDCDGNGRAGDGSKAYVDEPRMVDARLTRRTRLDPGSIGRRRGWSLG